MQKILFKSFVGTGYLLAPLQQVELIIDQLIKLGYFDIKLENNYA